MIPPGSPAPPAPIPPDSLAASAPPDAQKLAARMAQDAFSQVFRLNLEEDEAGRARGVTELEKRLRNWSAAGPDEDARDLRLALLMNGLDQWGLAYSRAFEFVAIPGLTELLGALRTGLDPRAEARLQQRFAAIDAAEGNAIDFKIELRRSIHLALWHAMIASGEREQAQAILAHLGGMMLALTRLMPVLGWRLVADALAHIQIQCLAEGLATEGVAREATESLFVALSRELPAEVREPVMAHAARAVLDWQQARRPAAGPTH